MKKIFIILVIMLSITHTTFCTDINLSDFSNEIKKYSNEFFPELGEESFLTSIISGDVNVEKDLFQKVIDIFLNEFKSNISLVIKIVGIAILCSILKNIQSSFGESATSEIAFYVCYILVVLLIVTTFTNIIDLCRDTISNISNLMKLLVPLIISLIVATGNVTTVAMLQPILISMIALITNLLSNLVLPVIFISTIINVISNISEHINVEKISTLLKKSALWITEITLIIFVGILSLEGSLSSTVDGITAKTAKAVVSSAIPVVGKILGDTVDSVIGGVTITKNAIGFIGILAILAVTLMPLIKTFIIMIIFNLSSALIEPIADKRIVKCMSGVGDSVKILFAVLATVIFLFIIAITFMLKLSNTALMYK